MSGLLSAGGIYDDSPTLKFLTKQFKNYTHMQREVSIGLTDIDSGDYKEFTEDTLSNNDDLLQVLYASFAYAGFFPPVEAFGSKWFDGSAVYDLDIFSPIKKCYDAGFKEEDLVIDTVFTSSANLRQVNGSDYTSLAMLGRFLEIASFYSSADGLLRAKFAFPAATFRYSVSPSTSLPWTVYPLVNLYSNKILELERDLNPVYDHSR